MMVQNHAVETQMHLFHSAVTEKEDEKDILTKNPEFLGVFAVQRPFFGSRFCRCKTAVFPLSGDLNSHQTQYYDLSADVNQYPSAFYSLKQLNYHDIPCPGLKKSGLFYFSAKGGQTHEII